MSSYARRLRSARLVVETLESRCTPAGHVAAVLSGSTLVITGDATDNAIQVEDSTGGVLVSGLSGTLINGINSQTFSGVSSLRIQMNQGNDVVYLGGIGWHCIEEGDVNLCVGIGGSLTLSGSLSVDLGAGNDQLTFINTSVGGSTSIKAGAGDDVVAVNGGNTFNGPVLVDLAQGGDNFGTANPGNTFNKALRIMGGAGNDVIFIQNSTQVGGTLEFQGQAGGDRIIVAYSTAKKLVIDTAAGNDYVQLDNATVHTSATVLLGTGDDELVVSEPTFGSTFFDGGPGGDTFMLRILAGNTLGSPSTIINLP
jgi:hypothetical protein